MKYRKKPIVIEAFQFDGDLINSKGDYYVPKWAEEALKDGILQFGAFSPHEPPCELFVITLEGDMHCRVGDYLVQDTNGEIYPCRRDIFEEAYEIVGE